MPTAEQREEMRTAILAAQLPDATPLAVVRRPRRAVWIGASVLAAAAAISIVMFSRSSAPAHGHLHASIRPHLGASYTTATTSPDEIVMLHDGSIDVDVARLHAGERFRVILADAEIEVHGTAFVATARAGHLVSVTVRHGIVEVRSAAAPPQRLAAGESWAAPEVAAAPVALPVAPPVVEPSATVPAPIKPPVAVAPRRMARSREPAPEPETSPPPPAARKPYEVAYDDAWNAMRAGMFSRAAVAFARVQILDPGGPLAEDAGLWYAIALERSGESAQAATAFRDFIGTFPASRRVGEANAMLGWILVGANQPGEAARRFRAAIGDPRPAIRDSAKAGLDAVAKMK
jgi:TolA-binding protein